MAICVFKFLILSGITKYNSIIVANNADIGTHIRNTGLNHSFYSLFIQVVNNDFLSYSDSNFGDMGFCMKWDANDVLFVMYSSSLRKMYWQCYIGGTWQGWKEL